MASPRAALTLCLCVLCPLSSGKRQAGSEQTVLSSSDRAIAGTWFRLQRPASFFEAEDFQFENTSECSLTQYHATGKVLGQGANGKVMLVTDKASGTKYAYKLALSPEGNEDIMAEIIVMQSTAQCPGTMPLTDDKPCLDGRPPNPGMVAYVSPVMSGNLWNWKDKAGAKTVKECAETIVTSLLKALSCFHAQKWVHGDLKGDNIYYDGLDEKGCPVTLKLADFGLTMRLGDTGYKFPKKYSGMSTHLPASIFQGAADPLGLSKGTDRYLISKKIDWCAFAEMARSDLGYKQEIQVPSKTPVRCGMMGNGRRHEIKLAPK